MNFYEMLSIRHEMRDMQRKWLVDQVAEMRKMQRAPPALVRSEKRKAAERAVDLYLEACEGR